MAISLNAEETVFSTAHPFLSWRSVLAGVLVSLFVYSILLALGVGFGGFTLQPALDNLTMSGMIAAVWVLLSCAVSLFLGSYLAARVSKFNTPRVGSVEGLVIAAVFFAVMTLQAGLALSWIGRGIGNTLIAANGAATSLAQSPQIHDAIENTIGHMQLKTSPDKVIGGLVSRLLRGDEVGAREYLAAQTNMSEAEVSLQINRMRDQFRNALDQITQSTARAATTAGWTLFLTMVIGGAAAVGGGSAGSKANLRQPLGNEEQISIAELNVQPV